MSRELRSSRNDMQIGGPAAWCCDSCVRRASSRSSHTCCSRSRWRSWARAQRASPQCAPRSCCCWLLSSGRCERSPVCRCIHLYSHFLVLLCYWQSTYIPVLPSSLLDFLHSPVPFLAGCHPLESTDEWPDVCFYNIDSDKITAPASSEHLDEASFPHGREFCRLLYGARERLSALRPSSKPWHELSSEEDKIVTLTLQEAEIFLRDLCFDVSSFDLTPRSGACASLSIVVVVVGGEALTARCVLLCAAVCFQANHSTTACRRKWQKSSGRATLRSTWRSSARRSSSASTARACSNPSSTGRSAL